MGALALWILVAGALWSGVALLAQARTARSGRRPTYAVPAGSALRGAFYSFTGAMLPRRKESVSRHPLSFGLGILLHSGLAASALALLLPESALAGSPAFRVTLLALTGTGLLACAALLLKRLVREDLRVTSLPDDFLSSLLVAGFLASTSVRLSGLTGPAGPRIAAALVLFYLPLGKLRHALFFFLARADLGRRLGLRGVYPPAAGPRSRPHG